MLRPMRPKWRVARRRQKANKKRFKQVKDLPDFAQLVSGSSLASHKTSEGIKYRKILRRGAPLLGALKPFGVSSSRHSFKIGLLESITESPIAFGIRVPPSNEHCARVKLAFSRNAVLIETVQGRKGHKDELDEFSRIVGMPWPNFLIKKLEAQARRLGYKEIWLREIETSSYYQRHLRDAPETARRMLSFYRILQKKLGFSIKRGKYWIKQL